MAKALALCHAVSLARDEGFSDAIFKTDCLSVVQRLISPSRDHSVVGSVLADVKSMAKGLSSVAFHHVRRHCNVLAHVLARSCLNSTSLYIFPSDPDCIRKTLCNLVA